MRILYAASEVAPLAKTGGLADVAGALPKAMAALGHEVAVVMPFYGVIDRAAAKPAVVMPEVIVDLPVGRRSLTVWRTVLPQDDPTDPVVPIYLIEDRGLFNRPHLYADRGREYPDNAHRFAYFCLAALWMLKGLPWIPDIIHCNDWQTALIPTYLVNHPAVSADADLRRIRVLFSVHNMSYQGIYPAYVVQQLGLPLSAFHLGGLEYHHRLNLLKGGLVYSHWLTTVSPQYAKEIQTPQFGCGLDGVLRSRAGNLTGILNGIDAKVWNPQTDPALPAHYSREEKKGKAICKGHLQKRFRLPVEPDRPLLAMISRMVQQKGFDLLADVMPDLLAEGVQLVLLGTGQPEYQKLFTKLAEEHPDQVGVEIGFNDGLAHQIEAGADIFLMPSHFEPCGLNQLYSLRYGAVPVVRHTGGLADSIVDATPSTIVWGKATGFSFTPYEAKALLGTIQRALDLYQTDRASWLKLMDNGMAQDFSWDHSAREYEKVMVGMMGRG